MLQHSWTPCLADGRGSAVQSGTAGHHSQNCSLAVAECAGFQSNQTSPTNFNNWHAFSQTERNKSAGVEFGWNFKTAYLAGHSTGQHQHGSSAQWSESYPCTMDALNVKFSTLKSRVCSLPEPWWCLLAYFVDVLKFNQPLWGTDKAVWMHTHFYCQLYCEWKIGNERHFNKSRVQ